MRGGRGWHGGISMNDEKDGIVEKACTVWSALGRELRLCLEITKVIRTITESTVQRNFCYSQWKHKDILWMNYFQCTEKVDGYPLDCKYRFKRLRTFVTWNFQSAIHRKNDRNQIDVPWHFPISRCSSILIFLVLFPFINSQPKYQHNKLLTLAFSKYRGWKKSLLRYYISRNYLR